MTSNLSVAPTGAWLAQGAEQLRQRGLSRQAAQLLASAAKRGLRVEWAPDGQRYATIHRAAGYEAHYIQVIWSETRTVILINKTSGRTWRNGSFCKKITGREASGWMDILELK